MAAEANDNLDIVIKSSFASDTKETFEVMGLKIETKNREELSEIIRNKISEVPHILDQAIFSVIEHMAAYTSNVVKCVVIKS